MYHLAQPSLPSLSCEFCDWFAGSTPALQTHLASQHSEDMFGCQASPACRQVFLTVRELRQHLTSSHHHQTFDCVKLVKAGQVRLPRDLRLARCVQCRASLYTEASRAGHGCGAGLSYECRACERYQLASGEKLETHINLRHGSWAVKAVKGSLVLGPRAAPGPDLQSFSCAACGHAEMFFADIDAHIQTKHKISRDNRAVIYSYINLPSPDFLVQQDCQICGSSFILPEVELLAHTFTCHGESKLPEFSHSQRISRTCRICLFNTDNCHRMENHLSREHRTGIFSDDHEDSSAFENVSSPQKVKSKVPSKLKVISSPEEKSRGFKKKSKKSRQKEGKSEEMMAGREKERRLKRRHKKKVGKKLAKMEMSELLKLKKQIESELENLNVDCAITEKKAVTLKKTVRFFGK